MFSITGGFSFLSYFSMLLALHPGFSRQWRPPPSLNSTLATFGCLLLPGFSVTSLFDFTASTTVLGRCFLPTRAFYLALPPQIRRICDSFVKKNTTSSPGGSRINFRVPQNFTKKSITIRYAKSKGFYCRLFWPKLNWNGDIMALPWVAKLSEQRPIFNWWHHGLVKKQLQYTYC